MPPPHFAAHGVGGLIGGIVGALLAVIPTSSHVQNGFDAAGYHFDTGTHIVSTNIFGNPVGTDVLGFVGLGAVIGIVVYHVGKALIESQAH